MGHRLLILVLATSTGCSVAFVNQPPSPSCTRSRAPAVADVVIAVATLLLGTAVTLVASHESGDADSASRGFDPAPYGIATGLVTAGYGISARYGFVHSAECRAAAPLRQRQRRWQSRPTADKSTGVRPLWDRPAWRTSATRARGSARWLQPAVLRGMVALALEDLDREGLVVPGGGVISSSTTSLDLAARDARFCVVTPL